VLTEDEEFSYEDLKAEFEQLEKVALTTDDPYFLGLYSGALFNAGNLSSAIEISERVSQSLNIDTGAVEGAETSITSSNGESLVIETTSIALINWLNQDSAIFSQEIDLGIEYILSKIKDGGRFGST